MTQQYETLAEATTWRDTVLELAASGNLKELGSVLKAREILGSGANSSAIPWEAAPSGKAESGGAESVVTHLYMRAPEAPPPAELREINVQVPPKLIQRFKHHVARPGSMPCVGRLLARQQKKIWRVQGIFVPLQRWTGMSCKIPNPASEMYVNHCEDTNRQHIGWNFAHTGSACLQLVADL